jgi:putative ATP-binding cassette transporter
MKLTYFLLRTFRAGIIIPLIVGLVAGASGAALIALINIRLSTVGAFGATLALSYAGLAVVVLVTNYLSQYLLARLAQGAAFDLRMRLTRQILAAPLRHLEQLGAHRLMASLTEDIPSIIGALLGLPSLCINMATLAIFLLYLGWLSHTMLVGMCVFMALGIGVRQLLVMKATNSLRLAREESSTLLGHYRTLTEGAKELKLHDRRRYVFFNDIFKSTAEKLRSYNQTGLSIYIAAESWSRFLYYVFLGLILFVLPLVQPISGHTLTGYTLIILYVMGPLGGILNLLPTLSRAKIALRQIDDLKMTLATAGTDSDLDRKSAINPTWQRLELIQVTHQYHTSEADHSFTLGPLDLDFRPGELIYLVGGNGSGKTTLAKLLTGLYIPESGEIRLDGRPITNDNREWYRQHFSAIFSDFYLFEKLLGIVTDDLDAQVRQYLDKLQLSHTVKVTDGALSTTKLSYGQRKRLALLTAYLEDRPFYVFDEWAAGQDPMFKELFYTQLLPELKSRGKTVLVISHDERYFHLADRLLKLDYGQLERQIDTPEYMNVLCETVER